MNYAVYLAAAVVIGLLIAMVALSVSWVEKTVLRSIRSKTIDLLSMYDQLLEEKSKALAEDVQAVQPELTPEKPEPEDRSQMADIAAAMMGSVQRAGNVPYRDRAVGDLYQSIRQSFSYNLESVLPEVERYMPQEQGTATSLLEKLDFETVYQLSTLDEQDQLEILDSVLDGKERLLLQEYARNKGRFRVLEFYDHLSSRAAEEPGKPRLWVAADVASAYPGGAVEVLADKQICEGYQVEQDNRLYDFSIKTRELS